MSKRIAINGFGRIGRLSLRNLIGRDDVELVAINDLTDHRTLAHLLKYDSAHGTLAVEVQMDDRHLIVNGRQIVCISERDPAKLPWKELGVDIVLECTGVFRTREKLEAHLLAGAGRVILSAPPKSDGIKTVVIGVNDGEITEVDRIVSNASCTTNCLAPLCKITHENWGFRQASMTTVHAYTADQNLQDAPHRDLRRARAAAFNMVPTSTGAASAVGKVYPAVKDKMFAMSVRVPIITGSLVELNVLVDKPVSIDTINAIFHEKSKAEYRGIIEYTDAPLVSSDIISNKHSAVFDSSLTDVKDHMVKLVAWYDNEAGYAARLAQLATML